MKAHSEYSRLRRSAGAAILFFSSISIGVGGAFHAAAATDNALKRIDTQRELYPQERLHVVTDRDVYCAGDTVWLRVFVTDAASLMPTDMSKYAYVELRDPFNGVPQRVKLLERDGVYAGYLPLAEDLAEGIYTLASYTAFSENVGQEYFFRKPLTVLAPHSSKYSIEAEFTPAGDGTVRGSFRLRPLRGDRLNYNRMSWTMSDGSTQEMPDASGGFSRKFSLAKDERVVLVKFGDYGKYVSVEYPVGRTDIAFYPEGGWLTGGEPCDVAFKATDDSGRGVPASGVVRDDTGAEAARFVTEHNGMGRFSLIPEDGRTYTADYTGPDGVTRTAEVGAPRPGTVVLRFARSGSRCFFSVAGEGGDDLELVLASRGRGVLAAPLSKERPVAVSQEELATGLYQALLVSRSDSAVLSERLFFVGADRESPEVAALSADSTSIKLRLPGAGTADCSVRVLNRSGQPGGGSGDIRTQLLLQSELRGRIENPEYYFTPGDREANRRLDLLMMVNGWSRYNLPEAIRGRYAEPSVPLEIGQEISGQVRSRWRNRPLEGVMVCAISPKADFGVFAETDSLGEFHLNGFDLPEDTPFIFRAMNENGGNEGNYDIYADRFPSIENVSMDAESFKADEISEFFRNSKWTMLDEITIQAFSKDGGDIYSALSSYTKTSEDFEEKGITTLEEAVRGIAGITERGGRLYWRGAPVSYFIDGVLYDPHHARNNLVTSSSGSSRFSGGLQTNTKKRVFSFVDQIEAASPTYDEGKTPRLIDIYNMLPFQDIERIDFLRSNQTLILGNGFGGVIMITTKDGREKGLKQQFDLKDHIPFGYQKYKEYASPLLSSETDSYNLSTTQTLLWLPSVRFGEEGKNIDFKLPVTKDCVIVVEGVSDRGPVYRRF